MINRDALDEVIAHAGEVARNDRSKWDPTYQLFEEQLGVRSGVIGKLLTQEKQLGNRIVKEMSEVNPRYVILSIVVDPDEEVRLSRVQETLAKAKLPAARCALIVEYDVGDHTVTPVELQVFQPDTVSDELGDVYGLIPVSVTRPESTPEAGPGTATGGSGGLTKPIALVPMVVDDRIRRAIRFSISTTSAVLLVGPPGTGKTALLMEVIDEIQAEPSRFGFDGAIGEPMIVTPEESWTAREIIGGITIAENDSLRFRDGHLLRAIRGDRWLVLDEANRADLDKIFGVMLTWLSDQEVDLGPVSTAPDAPSVCLGWSPEAASRVETIVENSDSDGGGDGVEVPIRYLAGHDWRLLGTYNALDAQRVFRFGQALGRRFLRVPVPPIDPYLFAEAAQPLLVKLNADARRAVTDLYAAHYEAEETQLGPALFMRIPDYVIVGLDAVSSGSQGDGEVPIAAAEYAKELLSEAYLVNVGAFLARYDESSLEQLGERIVKSGALSEPEWKWVLKLSRHLG
ncbi:MAG TPA: AAA family ATPase [Solirubrobacterales bacterium]|nr:AAA family ATPase [Solirubrobacterales bacterium]